METAALVMQLLAALVDVAPYAKLPKVLGRPGNYVVKQLDNNALRFPSSCSTAQPEQARETLGGALRRHKRSPTEPHACVECKYPHFSISAQARQTVGNIEENFGTPVILVALTLLQVRFRHQIHNLR